MAEDGEEVVKLKGGEGNVGVCLRVIFLAFFVCAFGCTLASMAKCNFLTYEPSDPPPGVADTRPAILLNVSIATIGLYQYNADNEGCREITDDFDQLSKEFTAARAGAGLAAIFAAAALGLLLIDFLCCRFPGSRFFISLLSVCAFFGQSLTFLAFAAPVW